MRIGLEPMQDGGRWMKNDELDMLPSDIRRKLAKLNIEREGEPPQRIANPPAEHPCTPCLAEDLSSNVLEDILPGRVHVRTSGELYIIERTIEDLFPSGKETIASSVQEVRRLGIEPEQVLFLDIETCGLANCPLFLIGTMSMRGDDLLMSQFFARNYAEEAAVLDHLAEVASAYTMLITFNGKTFDVPYMRDRMVLHRLRYEFTHKHLDLLHEARRLWRGKFPDCKLQTLEAHICGRRRVGDTPGHLIPQLYHNFVRTGNATPLEGVFHHNALDIITMAELLPHVLGSDQ